MFRLVRPTLHPQAGANFRCDQRFGGRLQERWAFYSRNLSEIELSPGKTETMEFFPGPTLIRDRVRAVHCVTRGEPGEATGESINLPKFLRLELLRPRPQFNVRCPSTAMLPVKLEIRLRNRVGVEAAI